VLFFGAYDPLYSRNRVLERAVRDAGHTVVCCHSMAWGPLKWLVLSGRLLWNRLCGTYDVVLVMFPAQTAVLIAYALAGRPVIVDFFTSHYEGYVTDRATVVQGSLRASWYWWQDYMVGRCADRVLVDTNEHAKYYQEEFMLDSALVTVVPVGTDTEVMQPMAEREYGAGQDFIVHWHGSYIPLQGAETVVRAAALLADSGIVFRMVGSGQTLSKVQTLANELGVTHIEFMNKVSYKQLAVLIGEAHVCLGIFGDTPKAQRVIPNKVYEALAIGRALVTADTPAIHEVFDSSCAMLVPVGDERALAGSIVMLMRNAEMRWQLAHAGHARFLERAGPEVLASTMKNVFTSLA
jgi:glycosyltransferase involved in cell wall biosynthesis